MNSLATAIKPISIIELLNLMTDLGYVSLSAQDMGSNIQECCVLFQPLVGPCNFAAYINVEYSSKEELLSRYSNSNGIQSFITEYGPLTFVPKLTESASDDLEVLLETGQWDLLHLEHCEDFITPYTNEDNIAISNKISSTLQCIQNIKTFGATDDVIGFLSNPQYEINFGSDYDLSFSMTPIANCFNELLNSPEITINSLKLRSANEVLINMNVRGKKVFKKNPDFDFIELNYAIRAKLDHQSKSIHSITVDDANVLVLSYDENENSHLIYNFDQWFNDCFSNIQVRDVFDQEVWNHQIKALCENSAIYSKEIADQIFE